MARRCRQSGGHHAAFTLVELLIVISIIAVLASLVLPALAGAMRSAQDTQCKNNLRVIGHGIMAYALANRDRFPPLAEWKQSPIRYWWGTGGAEPDFADGLLVPYLKHTAGDEEGLYECPAQPWGCYVPQGGANGPTTTYGYNGYYLCPKGTPGWAFTIGHRRWQTRSSIKNPAQVFVVADTLMVWPGGVVSNNCLLDPPWTYGGGKWRKNTSTTLCFRHNGHANVFFANGSVNAVWPTVILDEENMVGYVGTSNAPHYVPDWERW
jgi:prepilin-type N-terminal cleavage/methylation domain-containing protein